MSNQPDDLQPQYREHIPARVQPGGLPKSNLTLAKVRYFIQFLPLFWGSRTVGDRVSFLVSRNIFSARVQAKDTLATVASAVTTLGIVLPQLVIPLVVIPTILWLDGVTHLLLASPTITGDALISLLSGFAQLNGSLVGLYFATIGIVFSTTYLQVNEDLRRLFFTQPILRTYVIALVQLASISLMLCLLQVCGVHVGLVSILTIGFLSAMVLIGTVPVGVITFRLINPLYLIPQLEREILDSVISATRKGFKFNDRNFQAHYQANAERSFQTLMKLTMSIVEKQGGESLLQLAADLLRMLDMYAHQKSKIPLSSFWYKHVPKQQRWSDVDFDRIRLSLRAGHRLAPEMVPDKLWVEKYLVTSITMVLSAQLKAGSLGDAFALGELIAQTIRQLSGKNLILEASCLQQRCRALVYDWIEDSENTTIFENEVSFESTVSLVDVFAAGFNNTVLGFFEWCLQTDFESLIDELLTASVLGRELDVPEQLLREIEYVRSSLKFEREAEGIRITPDWYLREHFSCVLHNNIGFQVQQFIDEISTLSTKTFGRRLSRMDIQHHERVIEICLKLEGWLAKFGDCSKRLTSNRRLNDLVWKEFDWLAMSKHLRGLEKEAILNVASHAFEQPRRLSPSQNDYIGHSYWLLLDHLHRAIVVGDQGFIQRAIALLLKKVADERDSDGDEALKDFTDVVELSGFSKIYSELDGLNSWSSTVATWNEYMQSKDRAWLLNELIELVQVDKVPAFDSRSRIRSAWRHTLQRRLIELGLQSNMLGTREELVFHKHGSSLIRTLIRFIHDANFPIEVFVAAAASEIEAAGALANGTNLGEFFDEWNLQIARDRSEQPEAGINLEDDFDNGDEDASDCEGIDSTETTNARQAVDEQSITEIVEDE